MVAGHKRAERADDPRILEETRQYIRDFDRIAETAKTSRELYDQVMAVYPDRVNPDALWISARALKGQSRENALGRPSKKKGPDHVYNTHPRVTHSIRYDLFSCVRAHAGHGSRRGSLRAASAARSALRWCSCRMFARE